MKNKAFQTAVQIQETLRKIHQTRRRDRLEQYGWLAEDLEAFRDVIALCQKALQRKWYGAAQRVQKSLAACVSDLSYGMQRSKLLSEPLPPVPTLTTLMAELEQLDVELGPYEFNAATKMLSIVTEDIELEDVMLGPFRIELYLEEMVSQDSPYACVATEPNPASKKDTVTHPHVADSRLCEGEAKIPIRKALEQGRICDFFQLVVNTLNTYNPGSAYIPLDDWSGEQCYDCGDSIHGDEVSYCPGCDYEFCSYCSSYCRRCDETCCLGCGLECPECGDFVCPRCTANCIECKKTYCVNCLEDQICPACRERKQEDEDERQEDGSNGSESERNAGAPEAPPTPERVCPAIQPDGLGQAAVFPGQEPQ